MTSSQSSRTPRPDLVLIGVKAMRWRMRPLLGDQWEAFSPKLDLLVTQASSAVGAEQQRFVDSLLHLGLASPAVELFEAIVAHSHSAEEMDHLKAVQQAQELEQRRREELEQQRRSDELAAAREMWAPMYREERLEQDQERAREVLEQWRTQQVRKAEPAAIPTPPEPRYVNLKFADLKGRAIAKKKPLVAGRRYRLRVNIGALDKGSIVTNAPENVIRSDLLPPSDEGHWLKVAVVSRRFDVSPVGQWLFLPTTGPAWSCSCTPGSTHTCTKAKRRQSLLFPVGTPKVPGRADLRLTVYYERSVVQSILVTATIVRTASGRGSSTAVVDYNLSNSLTDLQPVQPRALSVMMNDDDDGSHLLVFNGAPNEVVALRLTDDQMTAAVTTMRELMRKIHIEDTGPGGKNKVNRYDAQNRKSREAFITDLRELACAGWLLWVTLWQKRIAYWRKNRDTFVGASDIIHVARKEDSVSAFPWALVYSIQLDTGAPGNNRPCKLLDEEEWTKFQSAPGETPIRCPFEATHETGVICPYGFWGFRYEIEQPASLQVGQVRAPKIPVDLPPLEIVLALSDDLDAGLLAAHLKSLKTQNSTFALQECHSRDEIKAGLGLRDPEVVYFYCHGNRKPLPGTAATIPTLGVGHEEVIAPPDLTTWAIDWPEDHWQATRPLVFINGCHTADTTPQTLVNFVDTFSASLDAGGVIGTEITLHQLVANEVAQTFLDSFQRGHTVGHALRTARAGLLRKGNLLGLVYTAYCSADFSLAASVV